MEKIDSIIYYKGPKECHKEIEWCANELGFQLNRMKLPSLDYYVARCLYVGDSYELDKSRMETLDIKIENMKKYSISV